MKQKNKLVADIFGLLLCVFAAVGIVVLLEIGNRGSFEAAISFLGKGTLESRLNILLALLYVLILFGITGRGYIASILGVMIFSLMGIVNISKMKFHEIPFLPWDIFLVEDALRVTPALKGELLDATGKQLLFVGGVLLVFFIIYGLIFEKKQQQEKGRMQSYILRGIILIFSGVVLFNVATENPRRATFLRENSVINYFWNQVENYQTNGFLFAFTMNISNIVIPKPAGYSQTTMESLYKKLEEYSTTGTQSPDIVVIMSESFSDTMKIKGLTLSQDPMKNFRNIAKEGISGDLYVPVLGGKTANTEFEFLTGYSTKLLPEGSVPYQQHIVSDIESLPRMLKRDGYNTTAIHNNVPEFWNRKKVYEFMGFDQFISIEDFKDPTYYGSWISDRDMTDKIIETLENEEKEKNFIFAVTVQNHAPYDVPDDAPTIEVQGNLSPEDQDMMDRYVKGIALSDLELERLYQYLKNREKPTILCFFGDHLPGGFEMYRTLPYFTEMKTETNRKDMFSTPFLIWANYKENSKIYSVGANDLAGMLLEYGDISMDGVYQYNNTIYKQSTTKGEQEYFQYLNVPENLQEYRTNQSLLLYNDVFGKRYFLQD